MPTPTPPKTSFSVTDFKNINKDLCDDTPCGASVVVSENPCPECCGGGGGGEPGPPGPQGPKGDPGEPGSASCPKIFAGPLLADPEEPIDPMAFEALLNQTGYIVRLQLGTGSSYDTQQSLPADISVSGPGEQGYIPASGASAGTILGTAIVSNTVSGILYPIAIKTDFNGIPNYTNINTFRDFIKARGNDLQLNSDYYLTGDNRYLIPSFLNQIPNNYTFISNDRSVTESANGPYNLKAFKDLTNGIIGSKDPQTGVITPGTIRYTNMDVVNPPSVTNLGKKIINEEGEVGVSYNCETCIQPIGEQYKLNSAEDAAACDFFVDTENGVLYSKDDDDPTKFRENGIPLRRTPQIPELPNVSPPPKDLVGKIIAAIPMQDFTYKWQYFVQLGAQWDTESNQFVATGATVTAYNGAENNGDLQGIGTGQFSGFGNIDDIKMLPIANNIVVPISKVGSVYMFSLSNAYQGCGGA